jgi:hypothetical protein
MAYIGCTHSCRKQGHLVGHGAGVGEVFLGLADAGGRGHGTDDEARKQCRSLRDLDNPRQETDRGQLVGRARCGAVLWRQPGIRGGRPWDLL